MRTFQETFKDRIDLTDGTVVLTEEQYRAIQSEAYGAALVAASEDLKAVEMSALSRALLTAKFYVRLIQNLPAEVQNSLLARNRRRGDVVPV